MLDKKLAGRIESKINTINNMIKLIDEDLEEIEDLELRSVLLVRLQELRATKSALMLSLNQR